MVTLNRLQLTDDLYLRLGRRATQIHRSVEEELVAVASTALSTVDEPMSVDEKLRIADELRAETPHIFMTEEMIRAARNEGRE